jgi:glucosamine-6-phosphate deaminase
MHLHVQPTAEALAEAVAEQLAAQLQAQPAQVLGLPTGRTPLALYRRLVVLHRAGRLDVSLAHAFQLDEFAGLLPEEPASFFAYLERHLFAHLPFPPGHLHRLRSWEPDAAGECARYEAELQAQGGLTLTLLGIGDNGHVAFNEPGPSLQAATHVVHLSRSTREANAGLFGGEAVRVPTHALTLGLGALMKAQAVWLLATGPAKARVLAAALQGPLTPALPASLLQLHPRLTVWADAAAAAHLG